MKNPIKEFFLKKFFFKIDAEERDAIRHRVMKNDHKVYMVLLPIIIFLEFVILLLNIFQYGFSFEKLGSDSPLLGIMNVYRCLYLFFIIACIACIILLSHFQKKNKVFPYFMVASFFLICLMFWGAGIALCDTIAEIAPGASVGYVDYTYLAIGLIGACAFITLEPWVFTSASLLTIIVFDILLGTLPQTRGIVRMDATFFLTTIVIVGIAFVSGTFNFARRIDAIRLELKVSNANEILSDKALVDDLTRVFNRRYLTEHIDEPLDYSENGSGVIMLDIDHFKRLNDTYGHQVGDECLSLLGIAINNLIRDKESYCVRYGGEEFLIFFKNITKGDLQIYAETLRRRIEKMKVSISGGVQIQYTISCGTAKALDGISYNNLINQADEALYKAKEERNRICYYGDIK